MLNLLDSNLQSDRLDHPEDINGRGSQRYAAANSLRWVFEQQYGDAIHSGVAEQKFDHKVKQVGQVVSNVEKLGPANLSPATPKVDVHNGLIPVADLAGGVVAQAGLSDLEAARRNVSAAQAEIAATGNLSEILNVPEAL